MRAHTSGHTQVIQAHMFRDFDKTQRDTKLRGDTHISSHFPAAAQ